MIGHNKITMTSETDKNSIADTKPVECFTLKIFFGPMFGCELHLPADNYFIIIHNNLVPDTGKQHFPGDNLSSDHAAEYALKTLYIPCEIDSPNIALHLSRAEFSGDRGGYKAEINDISGFGASLMYENEIFRHQHIAFALKKSQDSWSDEIINFNSIHSVNRAGKLSGIINEVKSKRGFKKIIAIVLIILLLSVGVISTYKNHEYNNELDAVRQSLAGSPSPVSILRGHDKAIYAIADDYRSYQWLKEAAFKLTNVHHITPLWKKDIKQDIVEQLRKKGYPVLQLDMTQLSHPVLFVYKPLNVSQTTHLKSLFLKKIHFADDIDIVLREKIELLKQARQGLDRLHIYYRQIKTESGYALVVRDALSDHMILALRRFIHDFYHQWGNDVINFSINLDENWLQNKSYLSSKNGYLFLNPLHWYFPISKGDL